MVDLADVLRSARDRPSSYGLHGAGQSTRYRTLIAFVDGIDIGTAGKFLADFVPWFRDRHGLQGKSSIAWFGQISHVYMPEFWERRVDYWQLSDAENDMLVAAAFDDLIAYASRSDSTRIDLGPRTPWRE